MNDLPQRVRTRSGIVCEHNCLSLSTAAAEMHAVATQNARVKDPVYHVVLSWPEGESPSNDEAFASGAYAIRSVGMAGHQYVFAVHRDTDHVHLHIAVNRVNPHSYRAIYPDRDYFKLDRAMRELELRFGWRHDNGPFAVFERDGNMVVDWTRAALETKGHMPTAASDMERHAGQESLFSYVRGTPRKAVIDALRNPELTWPMLHAVLAFHGLVLREKGQGFAVYDNTGTNADAPAFTPVKASDMHEDLSKLRLVRRLGAFEPSGPAPIAERCYDRFRSPLRDPSERDERSLERAQGRRALRQRYLAYLSNLKLSRINTVDARNRFIALGTEARRRRAIIRATVPNAKERKILFSVIAFETAREKERLREELKLERESGSAQNRELRRTYRDWVAQQAAAGDEAAISQLRGWSCAVKRGNGGFSGRATADYNGFRALAPASDSGWVALPGISRKVRRDGAIRHQLLNGNGFFDRGDYIEIHGADFDSAVCLASLVVATKKYGANFQAVGTEEFKILANGLKESLADGPSLSAAWDKAVREMARLHDDRRRAAFKRRRILDMP